MLINARVMSTDGKTVVREHKAEFAMPSTIQDAIRLWGEKVAFSLLEDQAIVRAQAALRGFTNPKRKDGALKGDKLSIACRDWKPQSREHVDPVAKMAKTAASMTDEQKQELIRMLHATAPTLIKKK